MMYTGTRIGCRLHRASTRTQRIRSGPSTGSVILLFWMTEERFLLCTVLRRLAISATSARLKPHSQFPMHVALSTLCLCRLLEGRLNAT